MRVNIITLGCSKNTVDSENLAGHLKDAGFTVGFDRDNSYGDVTIINTCGFIGDAKEQSIDAILSLTATKQRSRKAKRLVVVGCLVERYRKELAAEMPEVDAWFGVHQWNEIVAYVAGPFYTMRPFTSERRISTPRHYAYLKIAEGCNRSCTYCAIPLIRGAHHSRPIDEIVAEARQLVEGGVKELIIIAQDTTYYGLDIYRERRLGQLLSRLADESGAHWIRLHYTYPASFPEDAILAIRNHRNICNYIDIPLQHISTKILTSMQRGIDRRGTLDLLSKFRTQLPEAAIRTTLIAGYPGETQKEFEELKQFVREAQFDRMGCFAYSQEEGTPAELLGDPVPDEEKERRVAELMAIQEEVSLRKNEQKIGKTMEIIVDSVSQVDRHWCIIGRTEFDSPEVDNEVCLSVPVGNSKPRPGDFLVVKVTKAGPHDIDARLVETKKSKGTR